MDSVIKECKIHGLCQHNVDKNGKINSTCSIAANVSDCQSEEWGSIPPRTASKKINYGNRKKINYKYR